METILEPEYGDNKMVTALFGLSRQYLNKLEHDPLSGFPLPIKHGKNTRHRLESVRYWHRAKEPGNEVMLAELVNKRLAIESVQPAQAAATTATKPRPFCKRTLSQIERDNRKVLASEIKSDQVVMRYVTTSKEGAKVKAYRLSPRMSEKKSWGTATTHKLEIRPKKTLFRGIRPGEPATTHLPAQEVIAVTPSSVGRPVAVAKGPTADLNIVALKKAYEGGMSMDEICNHFKAGKTRVQKLLHHSGVTIRKPGRMRSQYQQRANQTMVAQSKTHTD